MPNQVKFGGKPINLLGTQIKTGDSAPQFTIIDGGLAPINPLEASKGKVRIISVFPSIDTPICSLQTKRFNQEVDALGDRVVAISVSNDLPFAQKRFCAAEGINNMVMGSAHRDEEFGRAYGVLLEGLRLLTRAVFIIDPNDKVAYVEYVTEVTEEPNYNAALEAVKILLD